MKWSTLFFLSIVMVSSFLGCASVSDSVVSSIDDEQFNELNEIYRQIQDFRINGHSESLKSASNNLTEVNMNDIYNKDYKAKILGLKSLVSFYQGKFLETEKLLKELKDITVDEEMFWIVSALMVEDKVERLNLLLKGLGKVYSINRLDSYLAYAYLENERYGEATALYDSILLEESDFPDYYRNLREISYLFMQHPPSSFETGFIIAGNQIDMEDFIDIFYKETIYFSKYEREHLVETLLEKGYFFNNRFSPDKPLVRKDLAYFLFSLISDRKNDEQMWIRFHEFYNPNLSDEMRDQVSGMSPIPDIPSFLYYFYPALYLIEEEIMELPDGENFFPNELVEGKALVDVIGKLENRVR